MDHDSRLFMQRIAMGIAASTIATAVPAQQPWIAPDAIENLEPPYPLVRQPSANDGRPAADRVATDPALATELQQRMERHRRELLPDYQHRLSIDGRASADAGLRQEAARRGKREAQALLDARAARVQSTQPSPETRASAG